MTFQSGQRERRAFGVHVGQVGEPTMPPPLILATIRGPSMPVLSSTVAVSDWLMVLATSVHSRRWRSRKDVGYARISLSGRYSWRWMMLLIAHFGEPVTSMRSTRSMSARSMAVVSKRAKL